MKNKFTLLLTVVFASLLLVQSLHAINETKTVGVCRANCTSLKAAFDAINAQTIKGNSTLKVNVGTTESNSGSTLSKNNSANASTYCTSVLINPMVNVSTINNRNSNGLPAVTLKGRTNSGGINSDPIVRTGVIGWVEGNHYDDATVWDVLSFAGDGKTAFAGGYYASTNRYSGGVWSPTATTPPSALMQNMAISNDGSIALAGGDYTLNIYSSGAWASTPIPGLNSYVWPCIAVAGDGSKLLAGARNGRMYIYDGSAWTETRPAGDANKYWMSADMSDDGSVIIAAVGCGYPTVAGRIYYSADGGSTWTEIRPDGDADHQWNSVSVSHDGNVLFAVYQGNNNVFKSDDGGATWTSENPNPPYAADINWRKIDASYDGNEIAASDYNGPLYYYSNGAWSNNFAPISCCSGDISLTSDGERLLVSNNSRTYMSFYRDAISDITFTSAIAHGTVTEIGSPAATQHGFVWSSAVTEPTVALSTKTEEGSISGPGTFSSNITGLTINTLYYIRAYATNANGTVYGDVTTFSTGTFKYVDLSKTSGANNGTSWADAYLELYSALNAAGEGDEIWVAGGTYKPNSGAAGRDASFVIPTGVKVYGGFAGNEANLADRDWETNVTILSGDIGTTGDNTDNAYHVVRFTHAASTTALDGFTVTKGYANGGSDNTDWPYNSGGGIYNDGSGSGKSSNPQIANCIISYNYSDYQGGGVHNEANVGEIPETAGEANPAFTNCTFTRNTTRLDGAGVNNEGEFGGVSCPSFLNCAFSYNIAGDEGGGVYSDAQEGTSSPVFTGCELHHNSADFGGAMVNDGNYGTSSPSVTACSFNYNTATTDAGAIYNKAGNGVTNGTFENCSFNNNLNSNGRGKGGAMLNEGWPGESSPVIINCSFTSNSADRGGAICNYGRDDSGYDGISSPTISKCTFKGNSATGILGYGGAIFNYGRSGGESSPEIINTLISGNVASYGSAVYNNDGTAIFINCTMSGNYATNSNGGTFYSKRYSSSSGSLPAPELKNCIIWHNNDVSIINASNGGTPSPVVHYSDIEGSGGSSGWLSTFGTDVGYNLDNDPVFASKIILTGNPTTAGDMRLTAGSPCADLGLDDYISEPFDIRGTGFGRFLLKTDYNQVGPVDMGAYEYKEGTDPLSPMPSLVTTAVTNITNSGGDAGGESIADNGSTITEKGIVWGLSSNPVLADNKIEYTITPPDAGTDNFALSITTAEVSSTIHVRAYATNAGGTAYGEDLVFSTLANVPATPTVANLNPGKLSVTVNPNGNPAATGYAIRETGGNFVQDDGTLGVAEDWKTAADWGSKAISGLTAGTEYTFSVKARNGDLVETNYSGQASGTPIEVPVIKWVPTTKIADWMSIRPSNNWYMAVSGDGSTVVAACGRLNISEDEGTNWTDMEPIGDNDGGWGKPALSYSGDTILVGSYTQEGRLWRSYDKGLTWTEIRPAGVNKNYKWYGLSVSGNGTFMYVTRAFGSEPWITFRSVDAGVTWAALSTSIFAPNGSGTGGVAFSEDNSIQFMAGDRLYKSTDYGATWSLSYPLTGSNSYFHPNISEDGNILAVVETNYNRYSMSTNGGVSWSQLPMFGGYSIAMSKNAKVVLEANRSNPIYFSRDSATTWKAMSPSGSFQWNNVTISFDGRYVYLAGYNGNCDKAVMAAFDPVTATTAIANGNIVSLSGTPALLSRGTIYYNYTDTDKELGNPGVLFTTESGTFGTGTYPVEITGLTPGTHYNARAYAVNSVGAGYSNRTDFWTLPEVPEAPTVDNPSTTSLDVTVNENGNSPATEYCINETSTSKFLQASGSLGVTAVWQTAALWGTKTVTSLTTGTTYTFKVKARNGVNEETAYSATASGTPIAMPAVSTQVSTAITATTATGNGNITNTNGFDVTNRGLILYPYTNTNKVIGDADVTNFDETETFGTGEFAQSFSVLAANTRYNARAHATNINGTAYGARTDFWTLAISPLPPFVGNATSSTLDVSVKPDGNPDAVVFAIQDSANNNFVQANGTRGATAVWQTRAAWATITITGLATGTTYYFRVKARNDNNTETAYSTATGANTCSNPTSGGTIASSQAICNSTVPGPITSSSLPVNYGGTLEYKWQFSTFPDSTTFTDIVNTDSIAFMPKTLTATTWYRRLARVSCKIDWIGAAESNVVKITVRPVFTAGAIETTGETICYNGDPAEIGASTIASGGDGSIAYQWQSSTDAAFTTPTDINSNTPTYEPPTGLTEATWYRRQAKDGTCNTSWSTSTGAWKVTPISPTPILTGNENVTQSQVVTYSTQYNAGNTYTWNASHGNPELCFPYRNCLTLTWDFPCGIINPGYVTVTETNQMGCSTTVTMWITIAP